MGSVVVVPDRKMVSTPSFPHTGWGAFYPSLQQLHEHRKSEEACNQGRPSFIINPHLTALKFTCSSFICIVMCIFCILFMFVHDVWHDALLWEVPILPGLCLFPFAWLLVSLSTALICSLESSTSTSLQTFNSSG